MSDTEQDRLIYERKPVLRRNPLPVPTTAINDSPTNAAGINYTWVSHIYSAVELLLNEENWQGTDSERQTVVNALTEWMDDFIA